MNQCPRVVYTATGGGGRGLALPALDRSRFQLGVQELWGS